MTRMSIPAAAARLNVSVDSVRRRLRTGTITGTRDDRGQWWLDLPDNIQPEPQTPSVDQRITLGMATGLAGNHEGLIEMLQTRIDDLLCRLEKSEKERHEDKERAAAERDRLLTLIETLSRQNTPR